MTQAIAFEALKADVGRQVQAPRPRALGKSAAEGPNDRLQADLIDFSQNTRGKTKYGLVVMDVFTREAAVEPLQNKNAETVGHATKRAARELTGDDGNFVVTTDLGNEFATLGRELPAVEQPLQAGGRGPQRAAPRDGARRARGRGEAAGHGVQGPPRQRRQVPAQQGPHRPAREGGGGRGRLLSADERGEELQPSVRRRAAAGGRGLHDRPQHGGPGDPAEAGAAGAEGSGNAAGRLTRRGRPAAVRQLDDFLAPPRPRTLD